MEKFYMQDSQEKQQSKAKKGLQRQIDFSVALSVVVAAFALFSIASFGIINGQKDTVSYAAPADGFDVVVPDPNDDVTGLIGIGGTDADPEGLNVPLYYANSVSASNRVYCVQLRRKIVDKVHYAKEANVATDLGLLYILNNSSANGKAFTGYTETNAEYVEQWATQAAIWLYLAKQYPTEPLYQFYKKTDTDIPHLNSSDPDSMVLDTENALTTAKKLAFLGGPHSGIEKAFAMPGVAAKVVDLVTKAQAAAKTTSSIKVIVDTPKKDFEKTKDGKFYQSALITVTGNPADQLKSYDISLEGIKDVKVVDENGKDLALTNVPAGKKFYVRIPVAKVTEKTQTLKVLVDGHFTVPVGVYYSATTGDYQRLIVLDEEEKTDQSGIQFNIIGAADTGMNAAQTIYFIGLIVLLCGIGIVYANTKPVESKQ